MGSDLCFRQIILGSGLGVGGWVGREENAARGPRSLQEVWRRDNELGQG